MKLKKLFTMGLALTFALSLASCKGKDKEETKTFNREEVKQEFLNKANDVEITNTSVVFTDAVSDKKITVDKNPEDVMILYGSFTTLWYEAGGSVKYAVGGTSATDLYKEYIGRDITLDEGIEVVATSSSGSRWGVETLVAKQPGIIFCSTAMSGYDTISAPATAAGIPVVAVDYANLNDYLKWFKVFSALVGKQDLYESIALKTLEDVLDVIEACSTLSSVPVLSLFVGPKGASINTEYTLLGAMIKSLNGNNIASEFPNEMEADRLDINIESIFAKNPKRFLVQWHEDGASIEALKDLYGDNAVWKELDAIKNGDVVFLQKTLYHNKPNAKFSLAYQKLAKNLYPDVEFDF